MREFITGILRDMEGNALLSLSSGRTEPTEAAPHGKLKIDNHHWFAYPAELDLMVAFAEKARADMRDAYLSPIIYGNQPFRTKEGEVVTQRRDGRPLYTRAKINALFSQTVYMDSDACPPEAFRLPPSRHVQTSEGHGHDYWFLPYPVPVQIASTLAHKITTAHEPEGCDPSGWSPNKVLRLPTWNTTYDDISPFEVTWEDDTVDPRTGEIGDLVYDISSLEEVYADVVVDVTPDSHDPLAPVPTLEGLPSFEELAARIPQAERRLNDLLYKQPKTGPDGWRSQQRFALLLDLKRFGFTDEEAIVLAWHSPVAAKFRDDGRNVDGLWWELQVRVNPLLAFEKGQTAEPSPEPVVGTVEIVRDRPRLLKDAQRRAVEARSDLVTLYMAYARSKVQNMNAPLHLINAWVLLALGLSEVAEIPKDPRALGLNLFTFKVSPSSTGKDEADAVLKPFTDKLYPADSPELAALTSREAFIESLIERTDRVSYIRENEADALLLQMKSGNYNSGVQQYWTRAYDGEVPSIGKVGRRELNKSGMHAILTMMMVGTPDGILKAIDKSGFYSGYLARQIWVLGEPHPVSEETMRSKIRRGRGTRSFDGIPNYLTLHLAGIRSHLRSTAAFDQKRAQIEPTDEAWEMLDAAKWKIYQHVSKRHDMELWKPVLNRFGDILWKIAGLSAASNGRTILGTRDVEVALYYAEDWIANVIEIADRISDTAFSKQCDEIEAYIASREGREAELGGIYRLRKGEEPRQTDVYLLSLSKQGRIEEVPTEAGDTVRKYRIKRGRA
jgi:hypothetical protein